MAGKRKRRSRVERGRIAERWLSSGMTATEFAAKHGVTTASLTRWAREVRTDGGLARRSAEFVEVKTDPTHAAYVRVEVGAVTLSLDRLPPPEYVAQLGRALC